MVGVLPRNRRGNRSAQPRQAEAPDLLAAETLVQSDEGPRRRDPAARADEGEFLIGVPRHGPALPVHQTMVIQANEREVTHKYLIRPLVAGPTALGCDLRVRVVAIGSKGRTAPVGPLRSPSMRSPARAARSGAPIGAARFVS